VDRILRIVPPPAPVDGGADAADDERLVAALKQRQPGAFDEVIRRHGAHLRRVLTRVLGAYDTEQADVMQEVAMNA